MTPKKTIIVSVVAFLAVLALLLGMLPGMWNNAETGTDDTAAAQQASESEAPQGGASENVEARPDCPPVNLQGVALPCLGGDMEEPGAEGSEAEYTIVSLWAWWCEPCRKELPLFDELAAKHPEYEVVGVHADRIAGNGASMLNELGVNLPSFQDSDNLFAGTLGLPGVVPITVVFDHGGDMIGFLPKPFEEYTEFENDIAQLIADNAA